MYYIKNNVDLNTLRKYGFKIGREIPNNERCICNDSDRDDYWLISMDEDEIWYADYKFCIPAWSIHIQHTRRVWIDCAPCSTYHIDNMDMEQMFYVLKCMIEDGIIDDDYICEE